MAKKLFIVWLSLTILLFSSISICAEQTVQGQYFNRNIVINGERIENYQTDDPLFLYKNLTYVPLTAEMGNILGISWDMNWESRTLTITKKESTQRNFTERWVKNNQQPVAAEILTGVRLELALPVENGIGEILQEALSTGILAATAGDEMKAVQQAEMDASEAVDEETANAEDEMITEDASAGAGSNEAADAAAVEAGQPAYEILASGDVIYVPVSAIVADGKFGWDVFYDSYSGIYLTTDGMTAAKATFDEPESRYNRGLVNYVRSYNGNYTVNQAQNLIFTIKREAKIYKVDPILIMAIAHKESTFTEKARSSSGALGIMQVMPSTGARYGLSTSDLLNAHKNIEFGTLYIKERIEAYDDNWVKALSAYNQGSTAVNRGGYSTRYADLVVLKFNKINEYLKVNGYGTGE